MTNFDLNKKATATTLTAVFDPSPLLQSLLIDGEDVERDQSSSKKYRGGMGVNDTYLLNPPFRWGYGVGCVMGV
jgi:hypothetical protein